MSLPLSFVRLSMSGDDAWMVVEIDDSPFSSQQILGWLRVLYSLAPIERGENQQPIIRDVNRLELQ